MLTVILTIYFALTAAAQPPSPSSKMLEQCDAGVAKACFDYSLYLQSQRDPKGKELARVYMRRACTMAYTPACNQRTKINEPVVKENPSGSTEGADGDALLAHRSQVKATVADPKNKMSVIESMGFRATPFMLKLFGNSAFTFTSSVHGHKELENETSH